MCVRSRDPSAQIQMTFIQYPVLELEARSDHQADHHSLAGEEIVVILSSHSHLTSHITHHTLYTATTVTTHYHSLCILHRHLIMSGNLCMVMGELNCQNISNSSFFLNKKILKKPLDGSGLDVTLRLRTLLCVNRAMEKVSWKILI